MAKNEGRNTVYHVLSKEKEGRESRERQSGYDKSREMAKCCLVDKTEKGKKKPKS
jgi:hypothetical protein